jgi:NAD(P)H-hydrate repair Nnr-like enzyme with NAD(P)H-hydrate epimerase domain
VLQRQTNGISYYYGPGGQGGDGMVIVHFKK